MQHYHIYIIILLESYSYYHNTRCQWPVLMKTRRTCGLCRWRKRPKNVHFGHDALAREQRCSLVVFFGSNAYTHKHTAAVCSKPAMTLKSAGHQSKCSHSKRNQQLQLQLAYVHTSARWAWELIPTLLHLPAIYHQTNGQNKRGLCKWWCYTVQQYETIHNTLTILASSLHRPSLWHSSSSAWPAHMSHLQMMMGTHRDSWLALRAPTKS